MFIVAVVVASINLVVYGSLLMRIHPEAINLAVGYSFWVDLIFTGVIAGLAAATGSLTALIISSVTGLFISGSLFLLKWWYGKSLINRRLINESEYNAYLVNVEAYKNGVIDTKPLKVKKKYEYVVVRYEASGAPKWVPEAVNSFMLRVAAKSSKCIKGAKFFGLSVIDAQSTPCSFGLSVVDAEENSAVQAA